MYRVTSSFMRRLARDTRGIAAVEFGYIAPVLLFMLLGSIEVARAISIDRRFGVVTSMTGDLISREKTIDDAGLAGVMDAIEHVMKPYDSSSMKLGVIAVKASPTNANDTRVEWSYSHNGYSVPAKCATYTLPAGLVGQGGSVIVVESSYSFQPLFTSWINAPVTSSSGQVKDPVSASSWTDKSTHSPRNSCVDYNGSNCVLACP